MDSEARDKAMNLCYELGHLLIRRGTLQAQMDVIREQIDEALDQIAPMLPPDGAVINVGSGYTPQVVRVYPDGMGSACVKEMPCVQPSQVAWVTPEPSHTLNASVDALAVAEAVIAIDDEAA